MSKAHLTSKYRPQRFDQTAGQEAVRSILSRAAAEGRIAPAYLFSGTRGVGKTTLARIFAKAMNCERGPTTEPCNECDNCRQITTGGSPDVVEMDAASHTGVDDVRALKEDIGFAPMQCRYKVFIIDEAHMLSKSAFNALLKTLEEPPRGVTFIMATTEPHKFPATIVSRCQHYVFKRLSRSAIQDHLRRILELEGAEYDDSALALVARRAAGSVRDGMSLLGQVLALGSPRLDEAAVREVLGLAGAEVMGAIIQAVADGDVVSLAGITNRILDGGLDIGFFLRDLTALWRNLFLLSQAGEAALPVIDLPEEESRALLDILPCFQPRHVHACWQMTLDAHRRITTSLEPGLGLELLLLNLACLPKLLDLEDLTRRATAQTTAPPQAYAPQGGSRTMPAARPAPQNFTPPPKPQVAPQAVTQASPPPSQPYGHSQEPPRPAMAINPRQPLVRPTAAVPPSLQPPSGQVGQATGSRPAQTFAPNAVPNPVPTRGGSPDPGGASGPAKPRAGTDAPPAGRPTPGGPAIPQRPTPVPPRSLARPTSQPSTRTTPPWETPGTGEQTASGEPEPPAEPESSGTTELSRPEAQADQPVRPKGPRTWDGFMRWCNLRYQGEQPPLPGLTVLQAEIREDGITLKCNSQSQCDLLSGGERATLLQDLIGEYFGPGTEAVLTAPQAVKAFNRDQLKAELMEDPVVRGALDAFKLNGFELRLKIGQ